MISVRSNNSSLKDQRLTSPGYKDKGLENLRMWQKLSSFIIEYVKTKFCKYFDVMHNVFFAHVVLETKMADSAKSAVFID